MAQRHSIRSTTEIEGRIFESYWEHSEILSFSTMSLTHCKHYQSSKSPVLTFTIKHARSPLRLRGGGWKY